MRRTASARSHRTHTTVGARTLTGHAVGFALVVAAVLAVATAPAVAVVGGGVAVVAADVVQKLRTRRESGRGATVTETTGTTTGHHAPAD